MILNGKQTNPWYAAGSALVKCPVPNCGHAATIITKIHCRMAHGIEREEVGERYGLPSRMTMSKTKKGDN